MSFRQYKSLVPGSYVSRRKSEMTDLRKKERESTLQKKRQQGHSILEYNEIQKKLEQLPTMISGVLSNDPDRQLQMTAKLKELLTEEFYPPIEQVIKSGVLPYFVKFLGMKDHPQLQFEAAWCLTNIAAGTSEHTKVVIAHGAIPVFIELLESPRYDIREQAIWALGNIAADLPGTRDKILNQNAMGPLLAQFYGQTKPSMLRSATWTLANLCGGKPQPAFDKTQEALPIRLIQLADIEVLQEACRAIAYLSNGTHDDIQTVVDSGVIPKLVELLDHPSSPSVIFLALRTIGNIATGNEKQMQVILYFHAKHITVEHNQVFLAFIIDQRVLRHLLLLLTNESETNIKREACWTISNITTGNMEQIQAVINAGIIDPLVRLLQNAQFDIKKEAVWAISNATFAASWSQMRYLVDGGCIKPLCDLLTCSDPRIVSACLKGLENILKVGEDEKNMGLTGGVNHYAEMIEEAEGLDKIESVQNHNDEEIYKEVLMILTKYWDAD
ncbi:importin subunit alpha-4-like [Cornus florida]|uniref:importin subunit alpha-4-like n=1 Tax=Cornus florida TaxID=4283 RepID=UPI00289EB3A4|nr:importin subunit alpha-4-like [Cornus florida]